MRAAYVVVYLLYLATSFQAALPQRIPELNTYLATVGSPASGVSTSSIQDHPELDQVDDSRFQRTEQEGDLPFAESDWVDSVVITVFFPKNTDERVAVLVGDDLIDQLNAGDYNSTRRTIPPCQVPFPAQTAGCSIGDDWVFVTWSVDFEECTKEWRLLLSGSSEGDPVSIGEITVLGPKESCDEDTGLPVGIWAAIGGGAALLLMILLCGCCCWRKRKNRGDATARHSTWQAHEENGTGQQHESLIAAGSPNIQPSNESHQPRAQPTISPAVQSLPYHQEPTHVNEMSKVSSTPEAVKHSASVTTTAASVSQYDTNQGFSGNNTSGKRYPQAQTAPHQAQPQQVVHAAAHPDMGGSDDEELEGDPGPGPTMYDATDQEEPIDPQQNAMLKDIHLQQAAGITEMIQGVKENLMNQQTLKHKGGDDGGLEIFNKIGGGGFGEVFKGKYREKEVAVKIMKIKPGARQESLTELPYTEAAIAGICIHQNIVQTMYSDLLPVLDAQQQGEPGGSYWSRARTDGTPSQRGVSRGDSRVKEWQVRMVMEICDLGSVRDWVSPAAGQKYGALYSALPNKAGTKGCGSRTLCALLTSLDVANGMKLLHKYKILHSDLKPHNVLLCSSHTDPRGFIAKLSDFGLSMKMAAHDGQVPGIKYGTVQYLAPEVLNTHIMTKKADVYSFGIIMWEVWHSRLFAEFYNNEKRKRKQAGQSMEDYRPMVSSKCPRTYVHLMTQCLDRNPDKRPDFLGGQVNIVVELERLIYEEYAKMAASAAAQAQ